MPNTIKHNFKELLDQCTGNTIDLKKKISQASGLSFRQIHNYYSNDTLTINSDLAARFIAFFNDNRHPLLPKVTIDDLFVLRNSVVRDTVNDRFNIR